MITCSLASLTESCQGISPKEAVVLWPPSPHTESVVHGPHHLRPLYAVLHIQSWKPFPDARLHSSGVCV